MSRGPQPFEFAIRLGFAEDLPTLRAIDDDASSLFAAHGIVFTAVSSHPFVLGETQRWRDAISFGSCAVAVDSADRAVGFAVVGTIDQSPFLEQVSVHTSVMRRGVGRALVDWAVTHASGRLLCLTTYRHLPWNAPYYAALGFRVLTGSELGPELVQRLMLEREVLPAPQHRVAMLRTP